MFAYLPQLAEFFKNGETPEFAGKAIVALLTGQFPPALALSALSPSALATSALAPSALVPSALAPSAVVPSALMPSALAPSALVLSAMTYWYSNYVCRERHHGAFSTSRSVCVMSMTMQ